MNDKLESIRAWLLIRRAELTHGLESNMDELKTDGHHLADLEELASDVSADGVVFEHFRSSSESIEQIEKALFRLESGEYFMCEDCGGEIAPERLEALPYASQCIQCRRRAEQSA